MLYARSGTICYSVTVLQWDYMLHSVTSICHGARTGLQKQAYISYTLPLVYASHLVYTSNLVCISLLAYVSHLLYTSRLVHIGNLVYIFGVSPARAVV